ncbi:hypothetical protein AVEN_236894-1 [Araneus ventricosus]|uniref:Uncharacterized protein n=1 Tax=Araneus ventricosus TaxID=182803 RepID=A0A4Y2DTZ8_ARAVE|nr:hypothetical protein AVEN_236894-1 [Araneus ventricosus]
MRIEARGAPLTGMRRPAKRRRQLFSNKVFSRLFAEWGGEESSSESWMLCSLSSGIGYSTGCPEGMLCGSRRLDSESKRINSFG